MLAYDYTITVYYFQVMFNLFLPPHPKVEVVLSNSIFPLCLHFGLYFPPIESTYTEDLQSRYMGV